MPSGMTNIKPKILIYDIETSPVLAWTFRIGYDLSLSHENVKDGQKFDIICIGYRWLGEKKTHILDWGKKKDSGPMLDEFSKILDQADVAVAHNGDKFDLRHINTQRLLNRQPPLNWPTTEDTLKQLRSHFAFPSNKLDYITKTLFGTGKSEMTLKDWTRIVETNCPKSLAKMKKYCKRDVELLAKTFTLLRPYITNPRAKFNLASKLSCPSCAHGHSKSHGIKWSSTKPYQRRRCQNCAHVFRGPNINCENMKVAI